MLKRAWYWGAVPLALTLALPAAAAGQGLEVFGYATIDYVDVEGEPQTFDAHNLNLVVLGKLLDDLFVAGEVEYEHGGDEIALEYGYLAFRRWRHVNITAGKFIVPFGRFNQDHPAWISRVPGRPNGFARVLPATYNDVGVIVGGGLPVGHLSRVTYDLWWVNGLAGEDGADIRAMRDNLEDVDGNKFVGGRLAYISRIGVNVGVSYQTGTYD
ncbi:MAG: hypothetical protein HY561_02240, partial [Gemmatimonadetes bacterium]|nr:hypothetical protein [Gemmatimonadota bacterium]